VDVVKHSALQIEMFGQLDTRNPGLLLVVLTVRMFAVGVTMTLNTIFSLFDWKMWGL
jgi:hypothetical protein